MSEEKGLMEYWKMAQHKLKLIEIGAIFLAY